MLFLKLPVDGAQSLPRVPLAESTARSLERALLSGDRAERRRELAAAIADDGEFNKWMLRAAEIRLGRTVNRTDEAADWLCDCLEAELASALWVDKSLPASSDVEWRLPALAAKLLACCQQLSEFKSRLEREKLEAMKELAYGASHEINNPLANIAARAQTLLEDEPDPERRRKVQAIHRQTMRAHEMIADLMLFARPPKLVLSPCDIGQLVQRIVQELADIAREYDVKLSCDTGSEPIVALADATQLAVAVRAVVMNAIESAADGGQVHVAAQQGTADHEAWAKIVVRDDGPGIPDDVRPHIFEPFFSGREAGRGLGFGLSKCWRIVTDHGGQVLVAQAVGRGAEFQILLKQPRRSLAAA